MLDEQSNREYHSGDPDPHRCPECEMTTWADTTVCEECGYDTATPVYTEAHTYRGTTLTCHVMHDDEIEWSVTTEGTAKPLIEGWYEPHTSPSIRASVADIAWWLYATDQAQDLTRPPLGVLIRMGESQPLPPAQAEHLNIIHNLIGEPT